MTTDGHIEDEKLQYDIKNISCKNISLIIKQN